VVTLMLLTALLLLALLVLAAEALAVEQRKTVSAGSTRGQALIEIDYSLLLISLRICKCNDYELFSRWRVHRSSEE
jgi:hypothetical protein